MDIDGAIALRSCVAEERRSVGRHRPARERGDAAVGGPVVVEELVAGPQRRLLAERARASVGLTP